MVKRELLSMKKLNETMLIFKNIISRKVLDHLDKITVAEITGGTAIRFNVVICTANNFPAVTYSTTLEIDTS